MNDLDDPGLTTLIYIARAAVGSCKREADEQHKGMVAAKLGAAMAALIEATVELEKGKNHDQEIPGTN